MKMKTFFDKFNDIANAPNAVAKIRELVFEWAATGKLCANPSVEWKEGVLGDVIELISGQHLLGDEQNVEGRGIPYLTGPSDFGDKHPIAARWTDQPKVIAQPGDILITVKGSGCGKTNVLIDQPTAISRQLMAIRATGADSEFIHVVVKRAAEHFQNAKTGIAIPGIGREDVLSLNLIIPPLAEQKRIVAKVDELMALCDRLEAQQEERETRHTDLARASLARFADAPTPANLNFLFHKSYDIDPADLRKSILSLAVQGKLVPQDTDDKPSWTLNSELPQQLRAIAAKIGARFSASAALIEAFDNMPAGWGVAPLASIGITQTGTTPSKSESSFAGQDIPFIKPGDIQGDEIDYENEGLSSSGLSVGRLIPKDSVLMVSIGGSIGKAAIVGRDVSCNQQINSISLAECIEPRFVLFAVRSAEFQREVMNRAAQGTLPIISKGKWEAIKIPVPPFAEQRRIVAKVDELMALVGQLEAQLSASREIGVSLLEAVVADLVA